MIRIFCYTLFINLFIKIEETMMKKDIIFAPVMLLIGILFGAMFKDAITTGNPFAKMSIFYFMLMLIFIPCNNQLGQRADTLLSFILLIMLWILSHYPLPFMKKLFHRKKSNLHDVK